MQTKNKIELKKYALCLLSKREYSKFELIQKLKKFADSNTIKDIIDELATKNLQSDVRFCESFIYSKKNKYGVLKLIYELNNKGISKDLYNKFLPSDEEEIDIAMDILKSKYKIIFDNISQNKKYINFLISRGFNYETAIKSIKYLQTNELF